MNRFIHSITKALTTVTANQTVVLDLPVNPLSVIYLHLHPLNETSSIGNYGLIERLLAAVTNIEVLHKGVAVISARGVDWYAVLDQYFGVSIAQSNPVTTNNDRRSIVLPIILGRSAFNSAECFPETKRGELQLRLTFDIAATGFDGLQYSIETLELPDASPEFVQRVTTFAVTNTTTGIKDIDLPIGNLIRAICAFGTTGFAGASPAPSLGQISILKDNIQNGYAGTDFEVSRQISRVMGRNDSAWDEHTHTPTLSGNAFTAISRATDIFPMMENYTLLDYDPTKDDEFTLETAGAGRVHMRMDAETADTVRLMVIEKVPASFFLDN